MKKETPEERLDRLERLIMGGGPARIAQQPAVATLQQQESAAQVDAIKSQEETVSRRIDDSNKELMEEMRRISNRIEESSRRVDERIEENARRIYNAIRQQPSSGSDRTFILSPVGGQTPYPAPQPQMRGSNTMTSSYAGSQQDGSQGRATSWVIYNGLSPFIGMNFGDGSSLLFGVKANYGFSSSRFVFAPDLYFGIGSKVAYGLNANVTYPLIVNNLSIFSPYVGIGLGLNKIDSFDFGVNMIAGTYIDIGNGSLFVEYTSRKFFDNNLISLGYRFAF